MIIVYKKIGNLKIKISGCINACGHHHVGNIGILGLDKNGEESYQITLGGSATENASIGEIVGPSFPENELLDAIKKILITYQKNKKMKMKTFYLFLEELELPHSKETYMKILCKDKLKKNEYFFFDNVNDVNNSKQKKIIIKGNFLERK